MTSGKNLSTDGRSHRSLTRGQPAVKRKRRTPIRFTDAEKTRAAELYRERPGDYKRITVRLFREFGIDRHSDTVRSLLIGMGVAK